MQMVSPTAGEDKKKATRHPVKRNHAARNQTTALLHTPWRRRNQATPIVAAARVAKKTANQDPRTCHALIRSTYSHRHTSVNWGWPPHRLWPRHWVSARLCGPKVIRCGGRTCRIHSSTRTNDVSPSPTIHPARSRYSNRVHQPETKIRCWTSRSASDTFQRAVKR